MQTTKKISTVSSKMDTVTNASPAIRRSETDKPEGNWGYEPTPDSPHSDSLQPDGGWDRTKPTPDSTQSESLQPEGGWDRSKPLPDNPASESLQYAGGCDRFKPTPDSPKSESLQSDGNWAKPLPDSPPSESLQPEGGWDRAKPLRDSPPSELLQPGGGRDRFKPLSDNPPSESLQPDGGWDRAKPMPDSPPSDSLQAGGGWDRSKSSSNSPSSEALYPEGGWGWVICFTSLMVNGAVFGVMASYGIIYNFLLDSPQLVGTDRSLVAFKTSWVGSVYIGTFLIINFFAALSCDRFGIRQTGVFGATVAALGMLSSAFVQQLELLYLTFGVVLGIGAGLLFSPSLVILGHYFKDRIGFVSGLVYSGSSIYTIILSLTLKKLLNAIGLQFTFLILCGIYLVMILGALSWKPLLKPKVNNTDCKEETTCDAMRRIFKVDLIKNRKFLLWMLAVDLALCGHYIVYVHLIKYSSDRFPDSDGDILLTVMLISALLGRLFIGRISDFPCVNRMIMHQLSLLLRGVIVCCVPFIPSFPVLVVLTSLIGILEGIRVMLLLPITIDILGPHAASRGLGLLYGSFAIPVTLGSPIAGFLYDKTGDYTAAFIGCFRIAAVLLMCAIRKKRKVYEIRGEISAS